MLIQEKKREKIAHWSWINFFVVLTNNLYLNYTVKTIQWYFTLIIWFLYLNNYNLEKFVSIFYLFISAIHTISNRAQKVTPILCNRHLSLCHITCFLEFPWHWITKIDIHGGTSLFKIFDDRCSFKEKCSFYMAGCDTLLEKLQYTLLKIKVLHAMPQKPPHSLSRSMKWGGCSEQWTHGKLLVLTASQGRCSRDVRTSSRESSQTSSTSPWHKPQFHPAWNLPQLSPYQRNQPQIASMTIALMPIIMKCFERLVLHHLKTCLPSTFDDH